MKDIYFIMDIYSFSYMRIKMVKSNLQTLLDTKGITRYKLAKDAHIKFQTVDNYYKNNVVRFDSYILSQICKVLDCQVGDILIYQKDDE